ncbi:hypothetical protein IMCC3317_34570 [Kordia antarctica]|uniref:Secretion system C-terminal sorting domain-containing protein n=1 Tax=Kordia antarctica TaxID=1218801 RepID=A0A7L4ZMX1_9FLAO|nr:T9SS type A sorting domain-containing protein [Kordia antarctica]QHI38073.1 hypothetical protein IMCC3317_34570 [Kordia antarctica]
MKKLLLLFCALFTYIGHCQFADNFKYIADDWFEFAVKNDDGSYLILSLPDDAILDFGYGKIMRFDQNFNQIGTTINFTNENADNCCVSIPRVAHFINNTEFAVFGSIRVDIFSNIYYSFAKYDNTGDTPLLDKRLVNVSCKAMLKGQQEHYALFNVTDPPDNVPNNGTDDFSFSHDPNGNQVQVVLLAYDDNLDEHWHIKLNDEISSSNEFSAQDMFQASNGDIVLELSSFATLEVNGTIYGQDDVFNIFYLRVNPTTQQIIAPVVVTAGHTFSEMAEDPYESGTYYLIDYDDVFQLDNNWNITKEHISFTVSTDIFFTEQDVIFAKVGSVPVNTPIGLYSNSVRYYDKKLNPKYDMRIFGNAMGENNNYLFLETKYSFVSYDNGVLECIQTYGTEHEQDSNYAPEIDGTLLPEFNGGFNTVVYNSNYVPLLDSEYNQVIQVAPATSVFNYVEKTGNGTLAPSDSHVSYLVFPSGFDFSQYPLNSLVPSQWYSIPDGWGESLAPRFRYDDTLNLYYFEIRSADNSVGAITTPSATRVNFLRVYLSDEQFVLSVNDVRFKTSIKIFPNPTQDLLTIDSEYQISDVNVFNLQGQKVSSSYHNQSLSIGHLPQGMYLLQLTDSEHRISTYKIVKE